ncbi:hypothetical protein [Microbacterium sp. JZ31]|uniref:hypothetical protein n=1 Tax=Microbacterium sp. JZ31 TaxID=1906274 RepID=UPI001931FCE4|nr:hypothetical protein [Microbacterium sp. JZ31]
MGNDIDDTTDQTPRDDNAGSDTSGKNGGRRLRFWLRAAEALIARERAYGGRRGVRERIEAAVPAEDLEVTLRTLEAIARELGDEHEIRAFGSGGRGSHPRHGFGPRGFGRGGFGRDEFEDGGFGHGGFGQGGFGRRGHGRGGFAAGPHHAGHRGFGPHGFDRGGGHAC